MSIRYESADNDYIVFDDLPTQAEVPEDWQVLKVRSDTDGSGRPIYRYFAVPKAQVEDYYPNHHNPTFLVHPGDY